MLRVMTSQVGETGLGLKGEGCPYTLLCIWTEDGLSSFRIISRKQRRLLRERAHIGQNRWGQQRRAFSGSVRKVGGKAGNYGVTEAKADIYKK